MLPPMGGKTEELLNLLLWTGEILACPTVRNLTESHESWAYRRGFMRRLQRLEAKSLLARAPDQGMDRVYRLTEAGRRLALGGKDPLALWNKPWDGLWRLVVFDVPESHRRSRDELRRVLALQGFGKLQRSVWLTPHPLDAFLEEIQSIETKPKTLALLQTTVCAGESPQALVTAAWDFERIHAHYELHAAVLGRQPEVDLLQEDSRHTFFAWLREEHEAWLQALDGDPCLPAELLPEPYLGRTAYVQRSQTMRRLHQRFQTSMAKRRTGGNFTSFFGSISRLFLSNERHAHPSA